MLAFLFGVAFGVLASWALYELAWFNYQRREQ